MDAAYMQNCREGARDALLLAAPEHHPSSSCTCCTRAVATPPPSNSFGFSVFHQPVYLYRCDTCRAAHYVLSSGRGFVQGVATYTVMGDLTVTPSSGVSSVALLKKLGFKDHDAVEERTVNICHDECAYR
ncbi:hypothetical protein PR202_ga23431 [Eleusine coracana subsp. coracana]|uniref:Uncharacterized protein n=1 Tax=Eleusine coracana subsp. coracana TaxID=191504 RepID=A0AAV5D6F5_ELECO|nr:hypothetical protein PR202_ga23431 [Eleusine coracana subsp. coracana]